MQPFCWQIAQAPTRRTQRSCGGRWQKQVSPSPRAFLYLVQLLQVFFYSMTGVRVAKQVGFGPQLEAEGISQACLYPDGIVVLGASSNQLWAVVGLQEPRAVRLPPIPGLTGIISSSAAVSCLAVLQPQFTLSNGLEVRRGELRLPLGGLLWAALLHAGRKQFNMSQLGLRTNNTVMQPSCSQAGSSSPCRRPLSCHCLGVTNCLPVCLFAAGRRCWLLSARQCGSSTTTARQTRPCRWGVGVWYLWLCHPTGRSWQWPVWMGS
jgi:hypothetical protein